MIWLAIGWVVFSIVRMFYFLFLVLGFVGIAWFTIKDKNAQGQLGFELLIGWVSFCNENVSSETDLLTRFQCSWVEVLLKAGIACGKNK